MNKITLFDLKKRKITVELDYDKKKSQLIAEQTRTIRSTKLRKRMGGWPKGSVYPKLVLDLRDGLDQE